VPEVEAERINIEWSFVIVGNAIPSLSVAFQAVPLNL
jgi:hypothetical protein